MQVEQRSRLNWMVAIALACVGGFGAWPARPADTEGVPAIDATHGVAVEGYDAVAYFVDHRPLRGSDAYTRTWNGVVWKFASAEHRALFAANPTHYAPQYGGYCAYAVANRTTAHGSPKLWAVVNGRLFLNNNALARQLWDRDRPGNIHAGDQNWPQIQKLETTLDAPSPTE
jgi:hypothetical protein